MTSIQPKVTPIPVVYGNGGSYYRRFKRRTIRIEEPPGFAYVVEEDFDKYNPYTGEKL